VSGEAEIEEYRRKYVTPGMTAGQFSQLLPEHLQRPYWAQKIEELLDSDTPDEL
jgi:hypothetical protein